MEKFHYSMQLTMNDPNLTIKQVGPVLDVDIFKMQKEQHAMEVDRIRDLQKN